VPAYASAVVVNLTAVDATAPTYLPVCSSARTAASTSDLNVNRDDPVANLVVVPIDSAGAISLCNHSGRVDLVADVVGYFAAVT
jgi:hypothetical protein